MDFIKRRKKMLTPDVQGKLKKMMIAQEGYKKKIYKDTKGNDTLGIGHLCANGFSDAVIDLIYEEDWQSHYNFLRRNFAWFDLLDVNRQLALISMSFNLGDENFDKFKGVIKAMLIKNYPLAAKEMLSSLWATQVPNRAKELAAIIETGNLTED
jgi:GH24 family phage-related lysozyme (muramidase)